MPDDRIATPPWTLALALGAVSPAFRDQLQARLPPALVSAHPATQLVVLEETTDALWDLVQRTDTAPWDACLMTSELHGTRSLVELVYTLHQKWPAVQVAVLITQLTSEARQLIAHCATYGLYNLLVSAEVTIPDLVTLLTVPASRDALVPYLDPGTPIWLPLAEASSADPVPDPASSPLTSWRSVSALRRLQWFRRAQEATDAEDPEAARADPPGPPRPVPSARGAPLWIRRRIWLVLGASGGVGTSTLVAALALRWSQHWGFTVGVLDAAPTGGYLNVALGAQIAETGWESGETLDVVAGTWQKRHWLVPRGTGAGTSARKTDVIPYVEAIRQAPVDVWLVDGGLDMRLIGRGAPLWDGILGVVRLDAPGSYAAHRWVPLWRDAPAFAGVAVMQHQARALHVSDWTRQWHAPILSVWPPEDGAGVWQRQHLPPSWQARCDDLTPQLLGSAIVPTRSGRSV